MLVSAFTSCLFTPVLTSTIMSAEKPLFSKRFWQSWIHDASCKLVLTVCLKYEPDCLHLDPLLGIVDDMMKAHQAGTADVDDVHKCIESVYSSVVSILNSAARLYVPECHKGFFKFWWSEELSLLKEASIQSNNLWKAAGKPRCGSIFVSRQSSRLTYRKKLRECQRMDTQSYTNDLHEALLHKDSTKFWQCWRSKFEINNKCSQVEGSVDVDIIVSKFASHFKEAFSCNNVNRAESLKHEYLSARVDYLGLSLSNDYDFDNMSLSVTLL